jgi:hypothetical protein
MGNNSVPKFIFRLSRFPVYRRSVLGRFYCIIIKVSKDLAACFFRVEQSDVQERRNIFANVGTE